MSERVVVYQDKNFQTGFLAQNPESEPSEELETVIHIHDLTPYGMLLASVASCTAIVVNTYAAHHDIPLEGIRVDATYNRVFAEDCEDCNENNRYEEIIQEQIEFEGDLDDKQRNRLHQVARACSVRRLLENGIHVESE